MEHEGAIVGCGGYSLSPDGTVAALQWGMVRPDAQRMGLGRFLLLYRIREIGKLGTVGIVVAQVPKPAAGFFEKQGFRVNAAGDDGRVELLKKLTVCS
jgi:N-acetylglutamate synthase-like GNAT family acetyltransferase